VDSLPSAIQGLRYIFDKGISVKYQTLSIIASCLKVLTWVVVVLGVIMSIRLSIISATLTAAITFLIIGFVATTVIALILLALSKLIYLFMDVEEELREIASLLKREQSTGH